MDEPSEQDNGFPSGPWVGYYTYFGHQGFHQTEVDLTFRAGRITGAGTDRVGKFAVSGHYHLETRQCSWTKAYLGQHSVNYQGHQSGKTIQGNWDIGPTCTGSFALWPEGEPGLAGEFFISESETALQTLSLVGTTA